MAAPKRRTRKVPDYLVKEILDGKPVYYKGYKSVLFGQKKSEEIMGSSSLQLLIIEFITRLLFRYLDEGQYHVFTSEGGLHLGHRNNVSGDILVYPFQSVPTFDKHYLSTPPLLQIEVDIDIDNTNFSNNEYLTTKTRNLLAFGAQKVIWVLSSTQTVVVAEPHDDWRIIDWNKEIELINGIKMNLGAYLAKMNVKFD